MVLGFDVAKKEIVGVLVDRRGQPKSSFTFENTEKGIGEVLEEALCRYPKALMGSEATGEHHNLLARMCLERGVPFFLLNPIVTKQFTRATVRKRKTDRDDALAIARCLLQGEGFQMRFSSLSPLKSLLRTSTRLGETRTKIRLMARRFQEHFPEESEAREELEALADALQKSAELLAGRARERLDQELSLLLCSIPGIGKGLAPVFAAEIGEVRRFQSAKALVAYAGLDPKVRQSGTALKRNTRLTKRGSPYLRRAAYVAASIAQRHDPELKAYYEKKRAEGKRYKEATVANARHILHRVYAVWQRGTPYVPRSSPVQLLTQD